MGVTWNPKYSSQREPKWFPLHGMASSAPPVAPTGAIMAPSDAQIDLLFGYNSSLAPAKGTKCLNGPLGSPKSSLSFLCAEETFKLEAWSKRKNLGKYVMQIYCFLDWPIDLTYNGPWTIKISLK